MATVARTVSVSANAGLLIQAVFQIRSGQRRLASGAVSRICVNVGTTCWANSLERLIKGEMIPSLIRLLVNLEVGVNVVFGNNRGQKRCSGCVSGLRGCQIYHRETPLCLWWSRNLTSGQFSQLRDQCEREVLCRARL